MRKKMRNVLPVFTKEFRSFFQSRMAWLIFGVYAILSMAVTFFQSPFISTPEPNLISFFKLQSNIFTLIIPALTIKLWTDEKRLGTLELTLSLPISYTALTIGKFLAVWALCGVMLFSTVGLWISTALVTHTDNLGILQNYLLCWLLCGALCALSLAASAFTAHPVSAFVLSLAVCLGFSLISFTSLIKLMGLSSEAVLRAGGALNFGEHFDNLIVGQITFGGIFYFISIMGGALWLNITTIIWQQNKKFRFGIFCICLLVSFCALNMAIALAGSSLVLDLSADKRYSLSAESKKWLKGNNNNLFVRLYLSAEVEKNPKLESYSQDVLRLLEQYQLNSSNKLSIRTINVSPLSSEEAEAKKAGIRGGEGKPYFGLVISDENGRFKVIPYLEPLRREYLEHDISRILSSLGDYQKPTIGIMSSEIQVVASQDRLDYTQDWPFAAVLRKDYDLRQIPTNLMEIPQDIAALLVINPKGISNIGLYAIDQYLMRGGNVIVFADPLSEAALAQNEEAIEHSNIDKFLANSGIRYNDRQIVGDNLYNRSLGFGKNKEKYPFWINILPQKNKHRFLAGLKPLALNTAGWLEIEDQEGIEVLFTTSDDSGSVDSVYIKHASLAETLANYKRENKPKVLAALKEGNFSSFFKEPLFNTEEYFKKLLPFLSVSLKPGRLLVVADSDILTSRLWNANKQEEQEVYDYVPYSGNMDFIERIADYMSGNTKILSISPKFTPVVATPIGAVLLLKTEEIFAQKQIEISTEQAKVLKEQKNMLYKIEHQEILPSIQVTKKLEDLERRRLELLKEERELKQEIINTYRVKLGLFMGINFVLPLMFLSLLIMLLRLYQRRWALQAERVANV